MAVIKCPGCGKSEEINLQGHYLVTCDECQKEFMIWVIRQRVEENTDITCPRCGFSKQIAIVRSGKMQVTCHQCDYKFIFSGDY